MHTEREYKIFQKAYDFFNERLFSSQPLPQVLITFQRKHKTYGYFSSRGFTRRKGVQFLEERIGEIAMNPDWFVGHSDLAILQTFIHEMCHVWQWGTVSSRAADTIIKSGATVQPYPAPLRFNLRPIGAIGRT